VALLSRPELTTKYNGFFARWECGHSATVYSYTTASSTSYGGVGFAAGPLVCGIGPETMLSAWVGTSSTPHHQHADEDAQAQRDSNDPIRILADSLVGCLGGSNGPLLQAVANFFGFLDDVFQFCFQFSLLGGHCIRCFHSFTFVHSLHFRNGVTRLCAQFQPHHVSECTQFAL